MSDLVRFVRFFSSFLWCCLLIGVTQSTTAEVIIVAFDEPDIDQWVYPFAQDPGDYTRGPVFGAYTPGVGFHPEFDQRDSQMLIGYDVSEQVTPGLGAGTYSVQSATLFITIEAQDWFLYDPTPDPFTIWLPNSDPESTTDQDTGHAIELFGTGFRNGFTSATYQESTPYSPSGSFGQRIRSAFPVSFDEGECIDISNNVEERFDPIPFAVGLTSTVTPGDLVPADTVFQFEIDVTNVDIHRLLRRGLHEGKLFFTAASIFPAEQQTTGTYPRFYSKENKAVVAKLVNAARLEMTVDVAASPAPEGDVDNDGDVDVNDLRDVILHWGPCNCCAADVNFDNNVNVNDLRTVILNWSAG